MTDKKFDPRPYLMNMRGKEYLEVKWRLVWFRSEHPGGGVMTELLSTTPAIVRATVTSDGGKVLGTGIGTAAAPTSGKVVWAGREIEKAETAAIGRALAHAGYGTQFAGEIDEDANAPADSPVAPRSTPPPPFDRPARTSSNRPSEPGDGLSEDQWLVTEVEVDLTKTEKLIIRVGDGSGNYATSFTRQPFSGVGYDTEDWKTPGVAHRIEPGAWVTVKKSADGKFWNIESVAPIIEEG